MRRLFITPESLSFLSFSFITCSMMVNSADHEPVVHNFSTRRNYTYTPSDFNVFRREDGSLYTEPFNPIVHLGEAAEETAGYSIIPEEAVSADEKVLKRIVSGRDGRMPIMNPELWPYRVHGRLSINFEGREYGGSGTLIGPHHLLTAGHNVFSKESGWASRILVSFAANGNYLPFDQQQAIKGYAYKKWIDEFDEEYDISLLVLGKPIGNRIGWYGLVYLPQAVFSERPIHIVGYPKDVSDTARPDQETILVGQFKKMWGMTHGHFEITPKKIYYQIDTSPGQSGSSIWYDGVEDKKYVVGIHVYGEGELGRGNFGVRIDHKKFENLIAWISETKDVVELISLVKRPIPTSRNDGIFARAGGGRLVSIYSSEEDIVDLKRKLDTVNAALDVRKEFTIEELESFLEGFTSLDSCVVGLKTTIFETLRFFNPENGNPRIAVIGGGYTGVFLCCQFANLKKEDGTPALDIHLFEKNLNLMQGASTAPARLHLGGEYPKDQTTALQCLISALIFKQILPTESILTTRKRIDFLLAKESTGKPIEDSERLTLEQLRDHYIKIHAVYSNVYTQLERDWGVETATRLFGTPSEFFSFLESPEKIEDECLRQHFAGGIKTSERGLQPIALGVILERLLAAKNIYLHLGHAVVGAESIGEEGYRLRHYLTTTGDEKDFFARYVVSAAWDENPYLTYQASVAHTHSLAVARVPSLISDQRPTKVYLRSIGLFDVSRCNGLPTDRSYFGLMGKAGAMVSFFSPTVAIMYVPEEDLSYQGRYRLDFNTERDTILDKEAQIRLEELRKPARQNKVLNSMLRNALVKYPFLRGAEPITLLTRPTLSWDDEIYQRQHIKPSWPLGKNSRWLQAFATKATFAPLIALQSLGQITRREDIIRRVNLSAESREFLENICRADLENIGTMTPGETQSLLSSIVKVPDDFVLSRETLDVADSEFLAEMQLYALKRHLPLTMIERFARETISTRPAEQIPLIDWRNLRHVDLRSVIPTQEILETLAETICRLPRTQGFQSFRFQYHTGKEETVSERYARAGQQILEALLGDIGEERPIEELEIDGLVFTLEEEVKALTNIIMAGALEKLTLTKFASHVPVGILLESFFLPLDRAESLKNFKLSFRGMPNIKTTKTLLRSMMVMPGLRKLSASHNNIGTILGEETNPNCFKPLEDLICIQGQRTTETLTDLDIADNELFVGSRFKLKDSFLKIIKSQSRLKVDIRNNGFHPDEEKIFEDSQMHSYLFQEIKKAENYYRAVKVKLEEKVRFEKERQESERQQWSTDAITHFLSSIIGNIFNGVTGTGSVRDHVADSSQIAILMQELRETEEHGKKQREQIAQELREQMERERRYHHILRIYEENRKKIQEKVSLGAIRRIPTIYIHYAPEMQRKEIVSRIYDDLIRSGLPDKNVFWNKTSEESSCTSLSRSSSSDRIEHVRTAEWIIIIGSPELKEQYDNRKITRINIGVISSEVDMIRIRDALEGNRKIVLIYQGGSQSSTFPSSLQHLKARLFGEDYSLEFLSLLKEMLVAEQEDLKESSFESNLYFKYQTDL